jgi:hypothetical protein
MKSAKPLQDSRADLFRRARPILAAAVASVPFACVFIVDYTLRQEGWPVWKSGLYIACLVSLLVGAWFWARHLLRGASRLGLAVILLGAAFVWVAVRTDWIVETDYEYMGQREHRTFTPPVRPLWHPPQPQELSPTATSWRDWDFFYIGGAGGPTEEPYLRINWALTILKLTLVTVPGYLVGTLAIAIYGRFHPTTVAS